MALCYEFGKGVDVSFKDAVRYYSLAADSNSINAQYNLAICYEKGKGVETDMRMAFKYYHMAAE